MLTGGNVGVYIPAGTFEISGGTISGDTGVAAKGGKLTITGDTISGTGAKSDFEHNGNGWNSTGDGLAIESCDYPYGSSTVSIQNATITSKMPRRLQLMQQRAKLKHTNSSPAVHSPQSLTLLT